MCVIVVTPSLNKSFKFQSDWPYNNSQVYLISSILEDLTEDEDRIFNTVDSGYAFTSSVNYPNNNSLVKQNVYIDDNMKITKVEVTDSDGNVQIVMNFNKIQYNKNFEDDYFELSNLININSSDDSNSEEEIVEEDNNASDTSDDTVTDSDDEEVETEETATIDDVIYPMYLPDNTTLANKEVIDTEDGQRLIMTFEGDNPFILVEETISYQEEGLIIPVSGSLDFLNDVIGVINDNSVSWDSNGIGYYLVSNTLDTEELIEIARSISVLPVSK